MDGRKRPLLLHRMEQTVFDVLIIGGGITGAGIALDAQSRGLATALIDMQDFGAGTSSRSTKLVHGGLRYLKQLEFGLVAEVGKERAIVHENGPHVTKPEWMLLPVYKNGTYGRLATSLGLRMYDFLAGVRREERRRMLSAAETLEREPLLRRDGLLGGGYYAEYRTDDARLTLEVLKAAVQRGCYAANYVKATGFLYENGRAVGIRAEDQLTGRKYEWKARKLINAAGPWVDTLREMDRSKTGKRLLLTKGVHLVFDRRRFPLRQAVYFDVPDGRMAFAIPRADKTYVGTTDTVYSGELTHPRMTAEDRDYLLRAVRAMFPELALTAADVESSWAGLRPLIQETGKGPSDISRKDEIWRSPSGLVTIAGGKLTGYRKMAEAVVDQLADEIKKETGVKLAACQTRRMPISGGEVGGAAHFPAYVRDMTELGKRFGFTEMQAERLAQQFGSNAEQVFRCGASVADAGKAELRGLPLEWLASLLYSMQEELAMTCSDFFIRRVGALYFDLQAVYRYQDAVAAIMAEWYGWSDGEKKRQLEELNLLMHNAMIAADS
nr:FAD-dependent oxidoreductase [Xylanibacillus composti]